MVLIGSIIVEIHVVLYDKGALDFSESRFVWQSRDLLRVRFYVVARTHDSDYLLAT